MAEEIITRLQAFLQEIKTEDYIKIKYEDLTETLEEAINLIQKQQEELDQKDKTIYYMANFINDNTPYTKDLRVLENERGVRNTNNTIKYFEKKVEENEYENND